jgi:hypothetical protein
MSTSWPTRPSPWRLPTARTAAGGGFLAAVLGGAAPPGPGRRSPPGTPSAPGSCLPVVGHSRCWRGWCGPARGSPPSLAAAQRSRSGSSSSAMCCTGAPALPGPEPPRPSWPVPARCSPPRPRPSLAGTRPRALAAGDTGLLLGDLKRPGGALAKPSSPGELPVARRRHELPDQIRVGQRVVADHAAHRPGEAIFPAAQTFCPVSSAGHGRRS